jgi:hypothetical protein
MIREGDIVRVIVEGKFRGQEVRVIQVSIRWGKISYQLNTKWDSLAYPAWFSADEIELVEQAS